MTHITTAHTTADAGRTAPWATVTDDDGRVWPIPAGGSDDDEDDDDEDDDEDGDEPTAADLRKWKRNARKWEKRAKANQDAASKLEEIESEGKSEVQKLTQQRDQANARAEKAEAEKLRLTVALDKAPEGMPLSKVRSLAGRIRGDDEVELATDAEELFADFVASTGGDDDDSDDDDQGGDPNATPKPKLKPGTGGSSGDTPDPDAIAESVMTGGF